jgi:hypothetical protein
MQEDKVDRESKLYDLSTLVVTIIEAQNVEFQMTSVTVSVKDQAHSTPAFPGQFPQFNSQFKYTGANLNDNIVISIHNSYDELQTLTGTYSIRDLIDQKIHDKWIVVKSPQKQFSDTKVHLQFQYVYSKAKISEEAIRDWKRLVDDYQTQNEKYRRDLEEMYKPFDFLTTIKNKPSYFSEIRPVDRFAADVVLLGNIRTQVSASSPEASSPRLYIDDVDRLFTSFRVPPSDRLQKPHVH